MRRKVHQIVQLLICMLCGIYACEEPSLYAFPAECPVEDLLLKAASNSTGILLSSDGQSYDSNLKCTVVLTPAAHTGVALYLDKIDLRPDCQDRLTVYLHDNEEVEYCKTSSNTENITVFSSDDVKIIFRSGPGSTAGYTGFEIVFTSIEKMQYGGARGSAIRKIAPKFKPKITKIKWKPRPHISILKNKIGTVRSSRSTAGNTAGFVVFCTLAAVFIIFGLYKAYKCVKEDEAKYAAQHIPPEVLHIPPEVLHIPPQELHVPPQELQTPQEQACFSDPPPPYNKCISQKGLAPPPPYSSCVPPENSITQF